jgi:hypothetical protein
VQRRQQARINCIVLIISIKDWAGISGRWMHRRQSWGGRDPPDFEVGVMEGGWGVVEGVVSGLLRSKGEGREPRTP